MKAQIDTFLNDEMAGIPAGPRTDQGLRVGRTVAARVLALRHGDGSAAVPPPVAPGNAPGSFRPTSPKFAPPPFTGWSTVKPFVLMSASQFRPAAPPGLTSTAYAPALNEAKDLGR